MTATVDQLVAVRSELADSLIHYYQAVIDRIGVTPWHRPLPDKPNESEAVHVSRIAVPVRVLKKVLKSPRRPATGAEPNQRDEAWPRHSTDEYVDSRTAQFYEEMQTVEGTDEVPWSRERNRSDINRVVVHGGPGAGKTFLTRVTAVELAEEGLAKLRDRRVPLDELPLPVWLDLESLANAAAADARMSESVATTTAEQSETVTWPANRLLKLLRDNYGIGEALADWFSQPSSKHQQLDRQLSGSLLPRVGTSRCWLILDGLDQVTEAKLPGLWALLEAIETQGWKCKIVLTCRTANYVKPPWKKITEYSLAPFGHSDMRKLIARWFGAESPRGKPLQSAIKQSYPLRHACRSPLLLTLACLVSESQQWTPNSRMGLYGLALDGLLKELWHGTAKKPHDVNVDDLIAILRPSAWRLFCSAPESNRFSDEAVLNSIEAARPNGRVRLMPGEIRDELVRRGLIFASGHEDGETQYSFLHRTFLEYLAAEHLCRELREHGWDKAIVDWDGEYKVRVDLLVKKMTWLPSWQETLVMLAAALGEDKDQDRAVQMVSRMMELMVDGK